MKILILLKITLILFLGVSANTDVEDQRLKTTDNIINIFLEKGDIKQLFKVYHFVYDKEYDYNTEEGVKKFKTFKASVKAMKEHNASGKSWKMGINHLSDMTNEEISKYYNIKPLSIEENHLRRLLSLDDYNDDDDDDNNVSATKKSDTPFVMQNVDWSKFMRPPQNQGSCGSCWAFATMFTVEGNYGVKIGKAMDFDLSKQQLLDCNTSGYGCNGGWYSGAFEYLKANKAIKETVYPYKTKKLTCQAKNLEATNVQVKTYTSTTNPAAQKESLLKGPIAAAVYVSSSFYSYKSGVWAATCAEKVNHAVTITGYSVAEKAWIIRNSWGSSWGDKGNMKIKDTENTNNFSCWLGRYGFRPNF